MNSIVVKSMKRAALSALMVLPQLTSFASAASDLPLDKFYMNYFSYEEYLYSESKKTEIGDQVELDISLGYKFSENTYLNFGFQTYPEENRFDNKTSKFEIEVGHTYKKFEFALDAELQTDESDNGGTSIGLDIDSEDTYISYAITPKIKISFFPFNFDGEVGEEFNTWDVTRVNYIEGSPSSVNNTPTGSEKIAQKTIPGFVLTFKNNGFTAYAGFGATTYLYPTNGDFDISTNPATDQWERREDTGYKFGLKFVVDGVFKSKIEYVGHSKAEETGSLLASAASFYTVAKAGPMLLELEATYSKAGKAPWRVSRSSGWFSEQTPFQPIYSDSVGGAKHNWIGKGDAAFALKIGLEVSDEFTPYAFYRHQGENFIFRERESAHRLRTGDETLSHGGLSRIGLGSYLYQGNFTIKPEIEYMRAKNAVFGSSTDIREDRQLSTFKKNNYQVYLEVGYSFDSYREFGL